MNDERGRYLCYNSAMAGIPRTVLEYESPEERDRIPFIGPMRMWRSITGWALAFALFVPSLFTSMELKAFVPLALAALALLVVASTLTLYYVTRAAAAEVSVGYAVRHLCLAVALYPVFLLGIFLVPRLVESDMIKWRLAERPPV